MFSLFLIIPVNAEITIDENNVILNDTDVLISTTYIKQGSGYIYPEITYKNLPGGAANIDLLFGVNDDELKFISGDYWSPHNAEWTTQHQQTFYNIQINGTYDNELLDYGNSYNTHKYIIDHDIANGGAIDRVTSNISFNSLAPTPFVESGQHTIFWHTNHSGIKNWKSLPDKFLSVIHRDYNGQNKWYILTDVPVVENEVNRLRIYMEPQHQIGSHSYKYDVATKLSSDTLQEAIVNNRFKLIDPYGDSSNFNSTWNTTKISTGSTNDTSIKLPLEVGGTYDFTVWWGDGNSDYITVWDQANVTHNYSSSGEYDVVIDGTIHGFRFNNVGDRLKLLDISNWGNLRVGNNNGYFYGCANFNSSATDTLDLTDMTIMYKMFYSASAFNGNISNWDTSSVTNMGSMFFSASAFNGNISNWDTSSVTNMGYMFFSASTFNQNISTWNTSSVLIMYNMFENINVFNQSLNNWDVSKVSLFSNMFEDCDGFNSPIGSWNTSSATKMDDMFKDTKNFNQDLSNWNVSKVTDMDEMFENSAIDQDFGNWNVSVCTDFVQMFNLETLSTANYDSLLIGWAALPTLASSEAFHAGNSLYSCDAESARNDTLIGVYSWTITDSGLTGGPCVGDTTAPTYNNNAHNTTEAGESVLFSIQYNDDTALHTLGQYIFATNNTGTWVNESAINWTSTPEYANVSKTLNSTHNQIVGYRWYSDDNEGNTNNTPIYTLIIQDTTPPVSITSLTNTTGNFWHNWTWINPGDADFNYLYVLINNTWTANTSNEYYNISADAHNTSTISIKTVDTTGNINSTWVNHTSTIPNNAITISNISASYTLNEGETLSIDANATDPDSDTPTFADNSTEWNVNFSNGIVYWATTDGDQGTYNYYINVTDGYSSTDQYNFTVTVIDSTPTVISNLQNTTGNFWVNWTWDAGSNTDDYDIYINEVDKGVDITDLYHNETSSAHAVVNISVRSHNHTLSAYSAWINDSMAIPDNAITITNTSDWSGNEGQQVYLDFDYTDPDSDTGTFDTNATSGNFDTATGIYTWDTVDSDQGTHYIDFNVTDGYGSTSSYISTITMGDSTPTASTNIQNSTSGLQITWNWTKGSNSDYTVVNVNGTWYENSTDNEYIFTATPHDTHEIQLREFNSTLGNYSAYTNQTTTIPNNLANFTGIPNKTTTQGVNLTNAFNLSDYFTDLDDDTPTFAVESNNDTTNLTVTIQGDNTVDFNVTADWNGTALVIFNATDSYGSTDNDSMVFSIVNVSANLNNFTFSNSSVSPLNVLQGHTSTISIDISDYAGTITTAIVKVKDTNYTMTQGSGDTWTYAYSNRYIGKHYITNFYAQDNDSAWNSTTSSLYINILDSSGSGSSGGLVIVPTATPTITPEPTPTPTIEKELNITLPTITIITDESINIFKFVNWFGKTKIENTVKADGIVQCIINDDNLIYECDVYDGVIHFTFNPVIDNIYNTNMGTITMIDDTGNEHKTNVVLSTFMWWPLLIIVGLFYLLIKINKNTKKQ